MFVAATAGILISMTLAMVRALLGPTVYDRVLAVNTFGTKTVLLIAAEAMLRPEHTAQVEETRGCVCCHAVDEVLGSRRQDRRGISNNAHAAEAAERSVRRLNEYVRADESAVLRHCTANGGVRCPVRHGRSGWLLLLLS